jgi:endonuclease YncB( thermonuclease family)
MPHDRLRDLGREKPDEPEVDPADRKYLRGDIRAQVMARVDSSYTFGLENDAMQLIMRGGRGSDLIEALPPHNNKTKFEDWIADSAGIQTVALSEFAGVRPDPLNEAERQGIQHFQNLERVIWDNLGNGLPLGWLVKLHPDDIEYFFEPEITRQILNAQEFYLAELNEQAAQKESVERRTEEILDASRRVNKLGDFFVFAEVPQERPDPTPEEVEAARDQARRELEGTIALEQPGAAMATMTWGMARLGDVINIGATVIGGAMEAGYYLGGGMADLIPGEGDQWLLDNFSNYALWKKISDHTLRQDISEAEGRLLDDDAGFVQAREVYGDVAWEELQAQGEVGDFMTMGLGDPVMAKALFEQYLDTLITGPTEVREQISTLQEQLDTETLDLIGALEERDFSVSKALVDGIAFYGHNVPLRLASYASVALTQEDLSEIFTSEGWRDIHEKAVQSDFSPAKTLGIEGTLQGFMLDFFGPIPFDPTVWIWGPRGRTGMPSSARQAQRYSNSPVARQTLKDAAKSLQGGRTEFSTLALLEGLDAAGLYDDAVRIVEAAGDDLAKAVDGLQPLMDKATLLGEGQMMPQRTILSAMLNKSVRTGLRDNGLGPWVKRYFTSQNTGSWIPFSGHGWQTNMRQNVIRIWGDDMERVNHWLGEVRSTIKKIEEPMTGYVDDVVGVRTLTDELSVLDDMVGGLRPSELRASARAGVETEAARSATLKGILETPDDLVFHGTTGRSADKILEGGFKEGGLTADSAAAKTFAVERRKVGGGKEVVLVFRKSELPPFIQRALAKGDDIGDVFAGLDAGSIPKIKPVGSYLASEGIEKMVLREGGAAPKLIPKQVAKQADQAVTNANQLLWQASRHRAEIAGINARIQAARTASGASRIELVELVSKMYDDFNRRYIATRKGWKKDVNADGIVPWEILQPRRGTAAGRKAVKEVDEGAFIPKEIRESIQEARHGLDPEKIIQDLGFTQNEVMGIGAPLSPIDLIAATELFGSKWIRWSNMRWGDTVRQTASSLHRAWMIDKVFKVSTGIVVSVDELVRGFQQFGTRAVFQYLEDRVMLSAAKAKAPFSKVKGTSRIDVLDKSRAIFKNERWNKRMQNLENYPVAYKQMERQFYETVGDGAWTDLAPKDPGYLLAADRFTANLLQDSGFRAFLRGQDDFLKWWDTPDAAHIRTRSTFDWGDGRTRLATAQEAFDGFRVLYEDMILKSVKPEMRGRVSKMWRDTAKRIDDTGQATSLPEWTLRAAEMPVRGVDTKAMGANVGVAGKMSNKFFDWMFMTPTNYRRGFFAELVRKSERNRLVKLYESQGLRVVADSALDEVLRLQGLGGSTRLGIGPALEKVAERYGVIPESRITRIVEGRVAYEMEHMMYSWHMTSRAGRSAANKITFPFGKPYADMWAYYGREALTRPALRGFVNSDNLGRLGGIADTMNQWMPVNPKPAAFISRVAATDFDLDKAPGEPDFSPLLFLPKEGENAFWSTIPGLGLLPMMAIDILIERTYDPIKQPEQHQKLVDSIAQWIPAVGFQGASPTPRVLGGGIATTIGKAGVAVTDAIVGEGWHEPKAILGDLRGEIMTNRKLKSILANPEEWEDLMGMAEEHLDAAYAGLVGEAYGGGLPYAAELYARWFVPARMDFDSTDDDVTNVWLEAATRFPEIAPDDFREVDDEQLKRQFAGDIRRIYYDLSRQERNTMLVEYPQLAVNLVGGWQWTDRAFDKLPDRSSLPYRSQGGTEGIAEHQSLITRDMIRPVKTSSLIHRIVGMVFDARVTTAKALYTETATAINEQLWEHVVSPAWKHWFEGMAEAGEMDITDGEDLWLRWGSLEEKAEHLVGPVAFPQKQQSWGTSYAGLDTDDFSKRFREQEINHITEPMIELADALDIDLTVGMTGEQLVNQISEVIRENIGGSALAYYSKAEYDAFNSTRSAGANAASTALRELVAGPGDTEFQQNVRDLVIYAERTIELRSTETGTAGISRGTSDLDIDRVMKVREDYERLAQSNPDSVFPWKNVWAEGYASTFGKLDWTIPTPPVIEDNPNAYRPFLWNIVDGDTLVVSQEANAPLIDFPGEDFDALTQVADTKPKLYKVRLLGVDAPELTSEEGAAWLQRLTDAIMEANEKGLPITLVRDPDQFGSNTDFYGRELAWLFIGDVPYYFEEHFEPGE